ncbi:hypothetical protein D3C71_1604720 [compost metagenome]
MQVASVSKLAIAQRARPVFTWPLNISATALISGKPGTSNSTLAAIATLEVWWKNGTRNSRPETDVATKAVRQKLISGFIWRAVSIWRTNIARPLAIKVTAKASGPPPLSMLKQPQDNPTISTTSHRG